MDVTQQLEDKIKDVIIEALKLEDYSKADIVTSEPLFGDGLGLDSIDALELGIAIKKAFEIELDVENDIKQHFYSVETLAKFISSNKENSGVQIGK